MFVNVNTINNSFPKTEKLKSKKDIGNLFSSGKRVNNFPLRAIYSYKVETSNSSINMGVSVPKKNIKLAVNRNLLKRRVREAYRLNNNGLKKALEDSNQQINIMFIYSSKQICTYQEIENKIKVTLNRLIELVENNNK